MQKHKEPSQIVSDFCCSVTNNPNSKWLKATALFSFRLPFLGALSGFVHHSYSDYIQLTFQLGLCTLLPSLRSPLSPCGLCNMVWALHCRVELWGVQMLKEPGLLKNGMFLGLAGNQFCLVLVKSQVGLQWMGQGALGSIWGYFVMDDGRVYIRTTQSVQTHLLEQWKLKLLRTASPLP